MKAVQLPAFDTLMQMHQDDPAQLERLRHQLNQQLIAAAHPKNKRRLAGLAWRIEQQAQFRPPMKNCIDWLAQAQTLVHSLADGSYTGQLQKIGADIGSYKHRL